MKRTLIFTITILGCIIIIGLLGNKYILQQNAVTFEDTHGKIIITAPKNWSVKAQERTTGTENLEAFPDAGLTLYVNGNSDSCIYVFYQLGHISPAFSTEQQSSGESVETQNAVQGTWYKISSEDIIQDMIIFDSFQGDNGVHYGISFHMNQETFNQNKEQIRKLISSMELGYTN